jgi:cupin fold WbuC family metalloprotein
MNDLRRRVPATLCPGADARAFRARAMLARMKTLSTTLLDELAAKAAGSPRRRAHLNLHASPADPVQRFFVAAEPDTYFRPHRHLTKSELALVLRGRFEILTFDDTGCLTGRRSVGEGTAEFGYETPRGTWHTLLSCTPGAIFLEVKEGPYDPATAAEFATWAPAEGDASVPRVLEWLRTARPGERLAS